MTMLLALNIAPKRPRHFSKLVRVDKLVGILRLPFVDDGTPDFNSGET